MSVQHPGSWCFVHDTGDQAVLAGARLRSRVFCTRAGRRDIQESWSLADVTSGHYGVEVGGPWCSLWLSVSVASAGSILQLIGRADPDFGAGGGGMMAFDASAGGSFDMVTMTRSALFAPFDRLSVPFMFWQASLTLGASNADCRIVARGGQW